MSPATLLLKKRMGSGHEKTIACRHRNREDHRNGWMYAYRWGDLLLLQIEFYGMGMMATLFTGRGVPDAYSLVV
jgi:hypothetical protein